MMHQSSGGWSVSGSGKKTVCVTGVHDHTLLQTHFLVVSIPSTTIDGVWGSWRVVPSYRGRVQPLLLETFEGHLKLRVGVKIVNGGKEPEKENQCCLNSNCDFHKDTCFVFNGSQYHRPASSPCCQSLARKQSHYGPVSFITSYRGQARLITVGAAELQAQCDAPAAQQPTSSIKGPDGFHTNSNATSNFLHINVCKNNVFLPRIGWGFRSHTQYILRWLFVFTSSLLVVLGGWFTLVYAAIDHMSLRQD